MALHRVMSSNDADRMPKSVDPDQTAPLCLSTLAQVTRDIFQAPVTPQTNLTCPKCINPCVSATDRATRSPPSMCTANLLTYVSLSAKIQIIGRKQRTVKQNLFILKNHWIGNQNTKTENKDKKSTKIKQETVPFSDLSINERFHASFRLKIPRKMVKQHPDSQHVQHFSQQPLTSTAVPSRISKGSN